MAQLVRVLDERKWALRCFYADLVSVLLVVSLGVALTVDAFHVGYWTEASLNSAAAQHDRDVVWFRMIIEGIGFSLAFAWLVYRVVRSGYKSITRNV